MKSKTLEADIQRALYGVTDRSNLETQLVHSIIERLEVVMGFKAYRRNVGSREWIDAQGKVRFVKYNEAGQADIWAIGPRGSARGIHIEVECKSPKVGPTRTLTSEQERFLNECADHGAIAICASTIEEFVTQLKAEFGKRAILWRKNWDL